LDGLIAAGMNNAFAGRIYVVAATKDGQTEFWAAATPRKTAAAEVQQLLPTGWMAVPTGWRLTPEKVAELNMRANSVRIVPMPVEIDAAGAVG
jgi:hypothetical protein